MSKDPILLTPELKLRHWGDGEWVTEPDISCFTHEGFKCVIQRFAFWEGYRHDHLSAGHFCGYVFLPENHPWFGKHYLGIEVEVHGGLTFGEISPHFHENEKQMYVIGFDCAHSFDLVPSIEKDRKKIEARISKRIKFSMLDIPLFNRSYKNLNYVTQEVKSLAEQAKKALEKKND